MCSGASSRSHCVCRPVPSALPSLDAAAGLSWTGASRCAVLGRAYGKRLDSLTPVEYVEMTACLRLRKAGDLAHDVLGVPSRAAYDASEALRVGSHYAIGGFLGALRLNATEEELAQLRLDPSLAEPARQAASWVVDTTLSFFPESIAAIKQAMRLWAKTPEIAKAARFAGASALKALDYSVMSNTEMMARAWRFERAVSKRAEATRTVGRRLASVARTPDRTCPILANFVNDMVEAADILSLHMQHNVPRSACRIAHPMPPPNCFGEACLVQWKVCPNASWQLPPANLGPTQQWVLGQSGASCTGTCAAQGATCVASPSLSPPQATTAIVGAGGVCDIPTNIYNRVNTSSGNAPLGAQLASGKYACFAVNLTCDQPASATGIVISASYVQRACLCAPNASPPPRASPPPPRTPPPPAQPGKPAPASGGLLATGLFELVKLSGFDLQDGIQTWAHTLFALNSSEAVKHDIASVYNKMQCSYDTAAQCYHNPGRLPYELGKYVVQVVLLMQVLRILQMGSVASVLAPLTVLLSYSVIMHRTYALPYGCSLTLFPVIPVCLTSDVQNLVYMLTPERIPWPSPLVSGLGKNMSVYNCSAAGFGDGVHELAYFVYTYLPGWEGYFPSLTVSTYTGHSFATYLSELQQMGADASSAHSQCAALYGFTAVPVVVVLAAVLLFAVALAHITIIIFAFALQVLRSAFNASVGAYQAVVAAGDA